MAIPRACVAAAVTAVTAMAHAGPGVTAIGPLRRRCFPALAGRGAADHVALTFDDGPDPRSTPRFLDALDSRGTHATFFLLGSMVARARSLAAELSAAGHEVGVHGWDHRSAILRGPRAAYDDIARAHDAVAEATGTTPAFSPRYGPAGGWAWRRCYGRAGAGSGSPERPAKGSSPRSAGISPVARRCCCTTRIAHPRRGQAGPRWAPPGCCSMSAPSAGGRSARPLRTALVAGIYPWGSCVHVAGCDIYY